MSIPLEKEPDDFNDKIGCRGVYEYCVFECGKTTKWWHRGTNNPVCPQCAKKHKVSELRAPKGYKPPKKGQFGCKGES